MHYSEHCKRTKKFLGEEFSYVHEWLDEFFGHPDYRTRHRKLRHHRRGIEEIRVKWGDQAARAATLHILDDLRNSEDKTLEESALPRDEEDFVRRGYW